MSKSLDDFFTIRQITEQYHPLALRHFLISVHSRSPLNYSVLQLEGASEAVYYIYQTLQDCEDSLSLFREATASEGTEPKGKAVRFLPDAEKRIKGFQKEFHDKMADDLNTSHVLTGAFQDALKFINNNTNTLKKKQQKQWQLAIIQSLTEIEKELKGILDILGLLPPITCSEIINVYNKEYESAAAFRPDVHLRVIIAWVISQLLLFGPFAMNQAANLTPFLIALPILTIYFHRFCKGRYEPAFVIYPLQEESEANVPRLKNPELEVEGSGAWVTRKSFSEIYLLYLDLKVDRCL
ncbi:cysteine--tRNA ligase 2, cytoplasmic-like [Eucalyptus grandis]|uniref:cysteine--tRNA ligase 2, cytoplasmic-like n=1 Tax=Eucalyptus grandis TaxID=71139 RepID=UPI00192E80E3|nr:cysteine--tRNA ligase 2, cytoplasmic-like [Eucalyptus grandis]